MAGQELNSKKPIDLSSYPLGTVGARVRELRTTTSNASDDNLRFVILHDFYHAITGQPFTNDAEEIVFRYQPLFEDTYIRTKIAEKAGPLQANAQLAETIIQGVKSYAGKAYRDLSLEEKLALPMPLFESMPARIQVIEQASAASFQR